MRALRLNIRHKAPLRSRLGARWEVAAFHRICEVVLVF